jgi:hypothetical protein
MLRLLAVIKCIYLPPTYLHFMQDIEDRCLLLMSSTSFVDGSFYEHGGSAGIGLGLMEFSEL